MSTCRSTTAYKTLYASIDSLIPAGKLLISLVCRHCSATPHSLSVFASRTPAYTQGRRMVDNSTGICLP